MTFDVLSYLYCFNCDSFMPKLISIIVPIYNEEENIPLVYHELLKVWKELGDRYGYEIIFVNDGSTDKSQEVIEAIAHADKQVHGIEFSRNFGHEERIRTIHFSRNFGKEMATTAGINHARGEAAILIDADMQHPPAMIPEFIRRWENGAEVVIGVRKQSKSEDWVRRIGSYWFYKIMNRISDVPVVPQATDFRLIDRIVIDEFNHLTEKSRITRGLIDWLGFRRDLVEFEAADRARGHVSYSTAKLVKLALVSFISLSLFPLRIATYLGIGIIVSSGLLGIVMLLDRYFASWDLHFSGPAMLADMILFLVGVLLIGQGLLAFYVEYIYREIQNRPMYIVRKKRK